jgi:hypothetical protein
MKHRVASKEGFDILIALRYILHNEALFRCFKIPKILQDSPSHRIFRRMHEALNIGKKITNYTVCCKSPDESFEPNWPIIGH